jgi:hypothetical protein
MEWTRNGTSHRVVILDLYLGYLALMGAPLLVPRTPIVAKSIPPPLAARVQREQEEAARKAKQHHVEHLKRHGGGGSEGQTRRGSKGNGESKDTGAGPRRTFSGFSSS